MSKEFVIHKRYNRTVKLSDGSIHSFATELETTVSVANAEEFVSESNKLFEQCRFLTEEDIKNTLGG
jgi:hypothetical protein